MLYPMRYDEKFSLIQLDHPIAEFHPHSPTPDEKKLILPLMMMPWENSLKFHQLYFLAVELTDDFRPPVFCERSKFFRETDLLHNCGF